MWPSRAVDIKVALERQHLPVAPKIAVHANDIRGLKDRPLDALVKLEIPSHLNIADTKQQLDKLDKAREEGLVSDGTRDLLLNPQKARWGSSYGSFTHSEICVYGYNRSNRESDNGNIQIPLLDSKKLSEIDNHDVHLVLAYWMEQSAWQELGGRQDVRERFAAVLPKMINGGGSIALKQVGQLDVDLSSADQFVELLNKDPQCRRLADDLLLIQTKMMYEDYRSRGRFMTWDYGGMGDEGEYGYTFFGAAMFASLCQEVAGFDTSLSSFIHFRAESLYRLVDREIVGPVILGELESGKEFQQAKEPNAVEEVLDDLLYRSTTGSGLVNRLKAYDGNQKALRAYRFLLDLHEALSALESQNVKWKEARELWSGVQEEIRSNRLLEALEL